jgi:hypothetical protein
VALLYHNYAPTSIILSIHLIKATKSINPFYRKLKRHHLQHTIQRHDHCHRTVNLLDGLLLVRLDIARWIQLNKSERKKQASDLGLCLRFPG